MAKRKIVSKLTYCPFCNISIANRSINVIQTKKGLAHYNCALSLATKELKKVGIPRPGHCSCELDMRRFLWQKAKLLPEKPATRTVRRRLKAVVRVSEEFFGSEIKISKLVV